MEKRIRNRKGQTKGKAVGKTSSKVLDKIKAEYPAIWKSYAWLPIGLTVEQIEMDAKTQWKYKSKFHIDLALALSTLIIIRRNSATEKVKATFLHKQRYVNVSAKDLKKWVHSKDYVKYLDFFIQVGYLKRDKGYLPGSYPKKVRWDYTW